MSNPKRPSADSNPLGEPPAKQFNTGSDIHISALEMVDMAELPAQEELLSINNAIYEELSKEYGHRPKFTFDLVGALLTVLNCCTFIKTSRDHLQSIFLKLNNDSLQALSAALTEGHQRRDYSDLMRLSSFQPFFDLRPH